MKSLFEQMDGTYTQQGDYYLPDLKLPPKEDRPIGVWGQRRLRYLRELPNSLYQPENHRSAPFSLADIEEQVNALFFRLVKDYAASEDITEQLEAEEPMKWVRRMNIIRV